MKRFAWFGLMLFLMAGVALAFQDAAPAAAADGIAATDGAAPADSKIPGGIQGILSGLIGGVMAVFLGWGKNKNASTGEMEKFDIKYAWPTLIIGAIVGLAAHWMNLTPQGLVASVETSPIFAGVVLGAEMLWKMIFRHTTPMIRDALGAIKGAPENPTSEE